MGPRGPRFVLTLELCSCLWVLVGFNMGIVWERPSRSPEGSGRGCRCILLLDLLKEISYKSVCVLMLGLIVVCAAQALRSSAATRPRTRGPSWIHSLLPCPWLQLPLSSAAGQPEAAGSGVICSSQLRARIQSVFPAILERCRSLRGGTDKSLGVLLGCVWL